MLRNRFTLIAAVLFVLLVSLAITKPFSNVPESANLSWPPRPVIVPVTGVNNLEAYYQSERTLVDPNAGLEMYQLSERTLIDPQSGLDVYFLSERTSTPFRNLASFNLYQQSEWFGK
jgi:hypothetical protein